MSYDIYKRNYDFNVRKRKLKDVFWAIRVVKTFVDIDNALKKIMTQLEVAGVDINKFNINNPFEMVSLLTQLRDEGADIDLDEVENLIESMEDLTFEDLEDAIRILEKFTTHRMRLVSLAKRMGKKGMSKSELDFILNFIGFGGSRRKERKEVEEIGEDEAIELTDEELEKVKRIVKRYQRDSSNR